MISQPVRPDRELLIIRQSSMKAAVEYATARPEMRCADVFKLAEAVERWVTRDVEQEELPA